MRILFFCLPFTFQVYIQEFDVGIRSRNMIFPLSESMPFIGKDQVLDRNLVGLNPCNQFIAFDLQYSRVIGPLHHHMIRR